MYIMSDIEKTINFLVEKMVLIIEKINILEEKIDQINSRPITPNNELSFNESFNIDYTKVDWNSVHLL